MPNKAKAVRRERVPTYPKKKKKKPIIAPPFRLQAVIGHSKKDLKVATLLIEKREGPPAASFVWNRAGQLLENS